MLLASWQWQVILEISLPRLQVLLIIILQVLILLRESFTVGAQIDPLYNAKFEHEVHNSCEVVKQIGDADCTLYRHELGLGETVNRRLPTRCCFLYGREQYPLVKSLLSHPHMDHYFVKERKEIRPSHYLAKLVLRHQYLNRYEYA